MLFNRVVYQKAIPSILDILTCITCILVHFNTVQKQKYFKKIGTNIAVRPWCIEAKFLGFFLGIIIWKRPSLFNEGGREGEGLLQLQLGGLIFKWRGNPWGISFDGDFRKKSYDEGGGISRGPQVRETQKRYYHKLLKHI